jgi:hypothetical protein
MAASTHCSANGRALEADYASNEEGCDDQKIGV